MTNEDATAHLDRIGPYHILDALGEGGMATVYLAEQAAWNSGSPGSCQ